MLLDAHAHLFHPRWYPAAFHRQLLGRLGGPRPGVERALLRAMSDATGESTLRTMDAAAIDRRIVLVLDWGLELGEAELSIRSIHEEVLGICSRFPDRLRGFAGIDPRRRDAVDVLTWAFDDLGARGLKLHPTSAHWTLADARTGELVAVAGDRGLPVLVHVGDTFPGLVDRNSAPAAFMALAQAFPQVLFIGGHAGFRQWRSFGPPPLPPNVLLDISGWQSLDDGTDTFGEELLALLGTFPGQVVFGTDSPFFGLPAAGADERWVSRVAGVTSQLPAAAAGTLRHHPLLDSVFAGDEL